MNKVITPEFRVSFPNVFEARAAFPGQKAKFSITMLFPKNSDFKGMKDLLKAAAIEEWGDKIPANLKLPFRDGDVEKAGIEGYAGMIFIAAASLQRPGVVDAQKQPIIEPSEFYAGCYARASLNAFTWSNMGKHGVSFGLMNLQKLRDGEPFSGKVAAEDEFDAVSSGVATSKASAANSDLFD